VALDSVGEHAKALARLEQAHRRFTADRDILSALAQFSAQAGDREAAARWVQKLRGLDANGATPAVGTATPVPGGARVP
jgi:Tfp pilus assembly protein PilF